MSKENYKLKLQEAMLNFKKAYDDLVDLFYDCDNECNDYIVDEYPFEESFDEYQLKIGDWVEATLNKIKEEK